DLRELQERNASLRDAIEAKEREVATARANCTVRQVEQGARTQDHQQTLVPPDANEARERVEQAQGTHGPLDITLAWNGREGLDLHVYCPDGHIFHSSRTACGGTLEIDRNANLAQAVDTPVEHVVWSTPPPPGEYRVEVQFYNRREQPERGVPYTVIVRQGDQQ